MANVREGLKLAMWCICLEVKDTWQHAGGELSCLHAIRLHRSWHVVMS